jgi:hypothetical protein
MYNEWPKPLRVPILVLCAGVLLGFALRDVHRWAHVLPGTENPFGILGPIASVAFLMIIDWSAFLEDGAFLGNEKAWIRKFIPLGTYFTLWLLVGISARIVRAEPTEMAVYGYGLSVVIYLLYIIGQAPKLQLPRDSPQASWRRWMTVAGIILSIIIVGIMVNCGFLIQESQSVDQLYSLEDWVRRLSLITLLFLVVRMSLPVLIGEVSSGPDESQAHGTISSE